jgi:hypothetical protein
MKLTPEQQVSKALKVLDPLEAKAQCKREVEAALDNINEGDGLEPRPNSKEVRAAVKRLLNRLEQAKREYEKLHKLEHAHAHELMMNAPNLDNHIAAYEEWLSVKPDPPRKSAARQSAAVKEARTLVLKYCKREQDHTATRGNAWYKLAAILFGDDQHDLYNHMRKFRPDPG